MLNPVKKLPPPKWYHNNRNITILVLLVIALVFIAYMPSLRNGFTNWDDQSYVTENALIKRFSTSLFTTPVAGNYHPLTMVSLATDYLISRLTPSGYHLTSLLLHLANTALVFYFIFLLSGGKPVAALVTALLFGIHPMHVESVAWVAARKDPLYLLFFLASLIAYIRFRRTRSWFLYSITMGLFLLSLLSKPAAVILPVILLLIDYFLAKPFDKRNVLEKIPFFLLSVLFGIITIKVQGASGAIAEEEFYTIPQKISFASFSLLAYLGKLFVPVKLSALYPYPLLKDGIPLYYHASPFIVAGLVAAVVALLRHNRIVIFGLLFFLVPLALVLQFISVGFAMMADRYTYLPYIGIFFIIGAVVQQWFYKAKTPTYALVVAALTALALSILTFSRCKVWQNSETLWSDVNKKFPRQSPGYYNRGLYLQSQQRYDEALEDYSKALSIKPAFYEALFNRGKIYYLKKNYPLTIDAFTRALAVKPTSDDALVNRGNAYYDESDYDKAFDDFTQAAQLNPKNAIAFLNRGNVFFVKKDFNQALKEYTQSIKIQPGFADAYYNRSVTYGNMNYKVEAMADAMKAKQFGKAIDAGYLKWLNE